MRSSRACLICALAAAGGLIGGVPAEASAETAPIVVRVFYLDEVDTREAVTLLRSEVQVRRIAEVPGRDAIVVADVADRVDRSESLLRQRAVLVRTAAPHDPLELERLAQEPAESRTFHVASDDVVGVMTILRAIYQMRDFDENQDPQHAGMPSGHVAVSPRAAKPVLDASVALLRELGLIAAERPGG